MQKINCILISITFIFYSFVLSAQGKIEINGKVVDTKGEALVGAYVLETGTNNGVMIDSDGKFNLSVSRGASITVSMLGYANQTVNIGDKTFFEIVLKDDAALLDEVVVVGFGTQKRKDLTSSIATVKSSEIENMPMANALASIQGRVAGVQITNSGSPGSTPSVRIRGTGSTTNSNPLYVVDGMIVDDISYLGPNDVESMSVLRDASAAAIYGVRAANGVILVSTKKGVSDGKIRVFANAFVGVKAPSHILEMVNTNEFVTLYNERISMSGESVPLLSPDQFTHSTAWFDEVLRSSFTNNVDVYIQGGNEKSTYNVGVRQMTDNGLVKEDDYSKMGLRANYDFKFNKNISAGLNMIVSSSKSRPGAGVLSQAFQAVPMLGITNSDGTYCDPSDINGYKPADNNRNPLASIHYNNKWANSLSSIISGYLDVTFLKNFNFRSTIGVTPTFSKGVTYIPVYKVGESNQKNDKSELTKYANDKNSFSWDNILSFENSFGKHNFKLMAGYSYREQIFNNLSAKATDIVELPEISQSFLFLTLGKGPQYAMSVSDDGGKQVQIGYLARINYDYNQKYLLNATIRVDGSSMFPKKNRWGYFPSLGLGWVISKEDFMRNSGIDFLKLRVGWGLLGNDRIPSNLYQMTVGNGAPIIFGPSQNTGDGQVFNTSSITQSFNPNLLWEVVDETNVGLDITVLNNKLSFTADYYYKLTRDAIFSTTSLGSSGLNSSGVWGNYANILNQGIELSLNWQDKIGKLNYNLNLNLTYNKNEMKKISAAGASFIDMKDQTNNIGPLTRTYTGRPVGEFFGYKSIGVFQTPEEINSYPHLANTKPGHLKFEDVNGDGKIDEMDRTAIGNPNPPFIYGFNIGLDYKGFDLNVFCQGVLGNKIYNENRMLMSLTRNFDKEFYDKRWTSPGSSNDYPSTLILPGDLRTSNSFYVEDGSYFRIKNIQLGYSIPKSILNTLKVEKIRFYASVENAFTFFKYNGFSPEVSSNNPLWTGINNGVYPLSSIYTFGVNLIF